MIRAVIVALLLATAAACVWENKSNSLTVSNPTPTPSPTASPTPQIRYVTDSEHVLDQSARNQLETTLAAFKDHKKIDFAVVIVGSSGNQSARDYSFDLARERNRHVHEGNENGSVFLLVAITDHKWHVQVSRNLESKLTNEILTTLSRPMTDTFRQKHYGEGIIKYVNAIITKVTDSQ